MKKILFYINSIGLGGAERVISNLAAQFSQNGCDCVLVSSVALEREYTLNENVERVILNSAHIDGSLIKRNYLLLKKLRKVIKEKKPDVIVSFMPEANFRVLISTVGISTKSIVSVRNDPNKEYPTILLKSLAKLLYSRADGIVFQTEDAKQWFPRRLHKKSSVIMNQVDESFYNVTFEGKRKNIVSVGRLVPQKNHLLLIEAFSEIAHTIDDNLIIYGEGELRESLEKRINELNLQNRVFLPGVINNVAETINHSKLFVLSSNYEGMPNVLMEAMAMGIPCISTECPCGGPRMLLGNIKEKVLVDVNDKRDLADTILQVVLSEEKMSRISEYVQDKSKMFLPEKVFSVWESYINDVLNENLV